MFRYLIIIPLVVWLAACNTGTQTDYMSPEDVAASRHLTYTTDSALNPLAERDMSACPEAMPTNGPTGSPHEVAGPLFCEF